MLAAGIWWAMGLIVLRTVKKRDTEVRVLGAGARRGDSMNLFTLLLAVSAGTTVSSVAWAFLRPPRRLRRRVAPYVHVVRTRLLRGADPATYLSISQRPARLRDAFEPALERLARLHARSLGPRDEEQLALVSGPAPSFTWSTRYWPCESV